MKGTIIAAFAVAIATAASAGQLLQETRVEAPVCKDRYVLERSNEASKRGDREAAMLIFRTAALRGECWIMPANLPVYVENISLNLRCIRVPSNPNPCVWTFPELLR